jgi:hypothetical protein
LRRSPAPEDALLLHERRLDLDAHEVLRIVEAPLARLVGGKPVLADAAISTSQRAIWSFSTCTKSSPGAILSTSMNRLSDGKACSSRLYKACVKPASSSRR